MQRIKSLSAPVRHLFLATTVASTGIAGATMASAENVESDRPFPSVYEGDLIDVPILMPAQETTFEKFKRKFRADPFVPLGFLTTAGILSAGLWTFKQGKDPAKAQRLMRYRVLAQGFTVAAFGAGSLLTYFANEFEDEAQRNKNR